MTKRTPPSKLVASAGRSPKRSWFDRLPKQDLAYINSIVKVLRGRPDVPFYTVASRLKDELGLSVNRDHIAGKLKELVNA